MVRLREVISIGERRDTYLLVVSSRIVGRS